MKTQADHRVFGFTESGHLRVNLHNGPGLPGPGAMYSWITGPIEQVANKLEVWYDQPLSTDEADVIEQLEATPETETELSIVCEDRGGSGRDIGSLNALEPEDCPTCNGTGRETIARASQRRPAGREVAIPSTSKEVA